MTQEISIGIEAIKEMNSIGEILDLEKSLGVSQ